MLRDMYDPAMARAGLTGLIYETVKRDLDERHRQDLAYLGSLGVHARRVELTRRRIARCERRFREALDFTPCSCRDDW